MRAGRGLVHPCYYPTRKEDDYMATASGRETYVLGKKEHGNREVITVEDGTVHDFPTEAKFTYADVRTRFPYELPV